jgi:hypothetical protein
MRIKQKIDFVWGYNFGDRLDNRERITEKRCQKLENRVGVI